MTVGVIVAHESVVICCVSIEFLISCVLPERYSTVPAIGTVGIPERVPVYCPLMNLRWEGRIEKGYVRHGVRCELAGLFLCRCNVWSAPSGATQHPNQPREHEDG